MSVVLQQHKFTRGPASQRHHVDKWLDGRIHRLEWGVDWPMSRSVTAFEMNLRRRAKEIGGNAHVSRVDEIFLVVQFRKV